MTESTRVEVADPAPELSATPPTIDDGVPDSCLVCTIRAGWGHFRRIDRTVTKQTYRLPPRTTVAGLLAAVAGIDRDAYYAAFDPAVSALGIEVVGDLRTVTQPSLGLGTNPDETFDSAGGTGQKTVEVKFPDSTTNRQIHSYEYVVDPAYRLYVAVEEPSVHAALEHHLDRGTSHYPPSMGLSELLASIETPTTVIHDVTPLDHDGERVSVDSAIPGSVESIVPQPGAPYHVERLPAAMERHDGGRRTTEFVDYAFTDDGPLDSTGEGLALGRVEDRIVAFY